MIGLGFGFRMTQWKANEEAVTANERKAYEDLHEVRLLYCGQHMEYTPRLCGCQILCPACDHRIVIPVQPARPTTSQPAPARDAWDPSVPIPLVKVPTRYRNRTARNAVLA
jgi:hypothetical protein